MGVPLASPLIPLPRLLPTASPGPPLLLTGPCPALLHPPEPSTHTLPSPESTARLTGSQQGSVSGPEAPRWTLSRPPPPQPLGDTGPPRPRSGLRPSSAPGAWAAGPASPLPPAATPPHAPPPALSPRGPRGAQGHQIPSSPHNPGSFCPARPRCLLAVPRNTVSPIAHAGLLLAPTGAPTPASRLRSQPRSCVCC